MSDLHGIVALLAPYAAVLAAVLLVLAWAGVIDL